MPGCRPGVVAAGPRDYFGSEHARRSAAPDGRLTQIDAEHAEAVGLEPTIRAKRTPVFETGPSSGRMTSFQFTFTFTKLRGLESNQRPPSSELGVTTSSNCPAKENSIPPSALILANRSAAFVALPAATAPAVLSRVSQSSSGRRIRTFIACFKGRKPTVSRSPSIALDSTSTQKVPCGS